MLTRLHLLGMDWLGRIRRNSVAQSKLDLSGLDWLGRACKNSVVTNPGLQAAHEALLLLCCIVVLQEFYVYKLCVYWHVCMCVPLYCRYVCVCVDVCV